VSGSRERAVRGLTELMIGELPADAVSKRHHTRDASGHHFNNCHGGCVRRLQCRRRLLWT
jgi:hypothetical protein